ncbi:MAG: Spy/CpxP family protein refolding chaperone [Deltaproteobacteria bacterium]|nr:Spy/CpxP family protein refolding chaperone [Candidatus Tharpella aukensis]
MKKIVCKFIVVGFILLLMSAVGVAADADKNASNPFSKKNAVKSFTPWWQNQEFIKKIELTKEQQKKIEGLTETYTKTNQEKRQEAKIITQELEKQLLAVTPIVLKSLQEKKASLSALRNQMFDNMITMKTGIHALLTESQRQKIAELRPRLFSLRSNWMRPQRRGKRSPFARPGKKIGPRQKAAEKSGK